jgi:hypothetical protein
MIYYWSENYPGERVHGGGCQMSHSVKIVRVDASNVADYGFFCYKSKPKSEGYGRKLAWLKDRFTEGMKLQIIHEDGRSALWSISPASTPGGP